MELKTESGVSITIIEESSGSKVLLFNKFVRAVELNREETSRIRALLASNLKTKGNTTVTREYLRTQEGNERGTSGDR